MKVLVKTKDLSQEEWLRYRTKGIGGSDVSILAGINPYKSVYQLWLEKTGRMMLFKRYVDAHLPFTDDNVASPIFDGLCRSAFFEQYYEEKRIALLEVIGFLISDIQNVKKAIFFIGEPNSGKSVLLRLITRLVGEENVSNVSLNGLGQRFSPIGLHNKALNASGEIPVNTLNGRALDVFKGITGGDVMELEAKGKQPFSGKINAKLLYAGNTLPAFDKTDGTAAVVERMI